MCLHLLPYLGPHLPYLSEGKPEATHWYRLLYMHTHSNVHEFIERLYFPLKLSGVFIYFFFFYLIQNVRRMNDDLLINVLSQVPAYRHMVMSFSM